MHDKRIRQLRRELREIGKLEASKELMDVAALKKIGQKDEVEPLANASDSGREGVWGVGRKPNEPPASAEEGRTSPRLLLAPSPRSLRRR